jgi:hypothetical protein
MESDDEAISLRASQDVLDRNPDTSKHSKQDISQFTVKIDPAQLAMAAQAAREMEVRRVGNSGTVLDGGSPTQSQ